jgi:DNA-binding LacI/PurR family transcriptional regulator
MDKLKPLPERTILLIAAQADCDPRTVKRVLAGLPVKSRTSERVRAQLDAMAIGYPGKVQP